MLKGLLCTEIWKRIVWKRRPKRCASSEIRFRGRPYLKFLDNTHRLLFPIAISGSTSKCAAITGKMGRLSKQPNT